MKTTQMKIFVLLFLVLLSACAVQKESPEIIKQQAEGGLLALPKALVSADETRISYPGESLFAPGAVLPLPGGIDVIGPLVDFFVQNPKLTAVATVRSSGNGNDYDRRIAEKRAELLEKIFRNRGVTEARLRFSAVAADGAPLELELSYGKRVSSAGEKL